MSGRRPPAFSSWQRQLLAELTAIASSRSDLKIIDGARHGGGAAAVVRIQLDTSSIGHAPGGLDLLDHEEFVVTIPVSVLHPPTVEVEHLRFLGFPHVLQGTRPCIYLDPSREWHPEAGISGFLSRLWAWLVDAAAARFDASTALYHAVGGVLHQARGTPTIVAREDGPRRSPEIAWLVERSEHRLDLTYAEHAGALRVPVYSLSTPLPLGAGASLGNLLTRLNDPYGERQSGLLPRAAPQAAGLLTVLAAAATRNPENTPQYFVLAIPHPVGGPAHLLGARISSQAADELRRVAARFGAAVAGDPARINPEVPIEWCTMSDERSAVTRRRDDDRPVNGFIGATVHVWGCGGLGSWIAEFVARAGASAITVCDPGTVTGGLLVRQNYVEEDVGATKATALAKRLVALRDDLSVTVADGYLPDPVSSCLTADVVIDATVSNAVTHVLDALAAYPARGSLIAQVATDSRSGTLGILNLCAPGTPQLPSAIDKSTGEAVLADSTLELYHGLWQEPLDGQELIPTRGCSAPTFHGSAADLAAVAACLVTLLGSHLRHAESAPSGTHLIALAHADAGPHHHFVLAQ